ncbi:DMT family transporter [Lentibacter algarum]|uniref:DMT family transporter n=1 Tax=Lentibacter algarum TaxID=576131 RepID=UPI001C07FF02|nr:DMT family transporter [Lentibacter algarum]MBU2983086.1 DMT family transporter [Lentibacter algarum]
MNRSGGIAFGIAAVFAWAIYNVGVEIGHQQGLSSADLTLLRYAGGMIVMLPVMAFMRVSPFTDTTVFRTAVLVAVAGPPFAWIFNTGYTLAPLSHAVVISPGMTMLVASGLGRWFGGAPLSLHRKLGMSLLILGLIFIASDQESKPHSGFGPWLGDLCFVVTGTLWGVFTWLMSHWKLDAVRTTGLIAICSTTVYLPIYWYLFELPPVAVTVWLEQFIYQGALGGALAVVFFAIAISRLGSTTAAVFPALVPSTAVFCAIPMTGQSPNVLQFAGLATASLGLFVSLGIFNRQNSRLLRSLGHEKGSL